MKPAQPVTAAAARLCALIAVLALGCGSKGAGAGGGDAGVGGAGMGGITAVCGVGGATGMDGAAPACDSNPADYSNPFQDPCAPIEDRISNLLTLLTLSERQLLLQQNQPAIARLGIPGFTTFTEGLHG